MDTVSHMSSLVVPLFRNGNRVGQREQAKQKQGSELEALSMDSDFSKNHKGPARRRAGVMGDQAAAIFSSHSGSCAVIDRVLSRDFWKAGGPVPAAAQGSPEGGPEMQGKVFSLLSFRRSP